MNEWLIAALALILGIIPCGVLAWRGSSPIDALVALEMVGTLATLALMLMAEGYGRAPFFDLAVVLAPLSIAGSLVFARFLERWV